MDEIELVQKGQRAKRLDRQIQEDAGAFVAHGFDDVAPLDELEREARKSGLGRRVELVDLDEVGVVEAREGRELATEGFHVLQGGRRGKLLQRESVAGAMSIFDEPNAAGSSLTEEPFHQVAVAGTVVRGHDAILLKFAPIGKHDSIKMSRQRDM